MSKKDLNTGKNSKKITAIGLGAGFAAASIIGSVAAPMINQKLDEKTDSNDHKQQLTKEQQDQLKSGKTFSANDIKNWTANTPKEVEAAKKLQDASYMYVAQWQDTMWAIGQTIPDTPEAEFFAWNKTNIPNPSDLQVNDLVWLVNPDTLSKEAKGNVILTKDISKAQKGTTQIDSNGEDVNGKGNGNNGNGNGNGGETGPVVKDKSSLSVHGNLTIGLGSEWNQYDGIREIKDKDGKDGNLKDVTVKGNVNTSVEGDYTVSYTYNGMTAETVVSVENMAGLKLKNANYIDEGKYELEVPMKSADNFDALSFVDENSLTLPNGEKTTDMNLVSTSGDVNFDKEGTYPITYSIGKKDVVLDVKVKDMSAIEVKENASLIAMRQDDAQKDEKLEKVARASFLKAVECNGETLNFDSENVSYEIKDEGVDFGEVGKSFEIEYTVKTETKTINASTTVTIADGTAFKLTENSTKVGLNGKFDAKSFIDENSVVNKYGEKGSVDDVVIKNNVDLSKEGSYTVEYTLNTVKEILNVSVEDMSAFKLTSNKVEVGLNGKFDAKSLIEEDSIIQGDGEKGNIDDIQITGEVDLSKEGEYTLTYKLNKVEKQVVVAVKDMSAFELTSDKVEVGLNGKFYAKSLIKSDSIIQGDGETGKIDDIQIIGEVDLSKEGEYTLTYKLNNVEKQVVVAVKDMSALELTHDKLTIGLTSDFDAKDLVKADSIVQGDGEKGSIDDVKISGAVDTSKEGDYTLVYQLNGVKKEAVISVKDMTSFSFNKSVENDTVKVGLGSKFDGEKYLDEDSIITESGKKGATKDVSIPTVSTTKEGTEKAVYKMGKVEKTLNVVVQDMSNISLTETKVEVGLKDPNFKEDDLKKYVDKETLTAPDGTKLDVKDVEIVGTVDISKVGTQTVEFKTPNGKSTAKLTVDVVDMTKINLTKTDEVKYLNDKFDAKSYVDSVQNSWGEKATPDDVEINSNVNTSKEGKYTVEYKWNTVSATLNVEVQDLSALELTQSEIDLGMNSDFDAKDYIKTALETNGELANLNDVEISGDEVDTFVEGTYIVKYKLGNKTAELKVNVINYTQLKVKDLSITVGGTWNPSDAILEVIQPDGSKGNIEDVEVDGDVDTNTVGEYDITYKYEGKTAVSKVSVVDNRSLEVQNVNLGFKDEWKPEMGFVSATDKDGNQVGFDQVKVTGEVNTSVPGDYKVTYSYENFTKEINVNVAVNQTSVVAQDVTIPHGSQWNPAQAFVSATDKNGNAIPLEQVKVEGSVNTSQAGVYPVTYSYGGETTTINVTVRENYSSLEVKDVTVEYGADWNYGMNFVSATDVDGNQLSSSDVAYSNNVNTNVAGTYNVVFVNGNLKKTAKVTVNKPSIPQGDFSNLSEKVPTYSASMTAQIEQSVNNFRVQNGQKSLPVSQASRDLSNIDAQNNVSDNYLNWSANHNENAIGTTFSIIGAATEGEAVQKAMNNWINSPGHKDAMLWDDNGDIGSSVYVMKTTKNGTVIYTFEFITTMQPDWML